MSVLWCFHARAMVNPGKTAFSAFGFDFQWAGLFFAVSVILAIVLLSIRCKRHALPKDAATDLCLILIPACLIGARVWYVLAHFTAYVSEPVTALYFWDGGLDFYGAFVFGLLGIWAYARASKTSFLLLSDMIAPGAVLALGIAKIGDFFMQSGYGPVVQASGLKWFPFAVLIDSTGEIRYAFFFYTLLWCVLLFLLAILVLEKKPARAGKVFLTVFLLYLPFDIILRVFREGNAALLWRFSFSQLTALALFILFLIVALVRAFGAKAPQALPSAADASVSSMEKEPSEAPRPYQLTPVPPLANSDEIPPRPAPVIHMDDEE